MTIFLDAAPIAGGIAIIGSVVFFLIFAAVAFIAFRLLRRTVKMAFRVAIVAIILAIAVAGSISFWWLGGGKTTRPERPRPSQPK